MTSATDDELFASLGNSLMRDLLSDIEGGSSDTNPSSTNTGGGVGVSSNMMNTLSILEEELDKQQQQQISPTTPQPSQGPPGLRPPGLGLSRPSVAQMVVQHASSVPTPEPQRRGAPNGSHGGGGGGGDAWGEALHQFSALSLTEDFLKADSARKSQTVGRSGGGGIEKSGSRDAADLVDRLLFDEDEEVDGGDGGLKEGDRVEEYDVTAKLVLPTNTGAGITTVEKTAPGFFAPVPPSSGGGGGDTTSPIDGVGGTTSPIPMPPHSQMMQNMPIRHPQQLHGGPPPPLMGTVPTPLATMSSPQPPRTNMGHPMPPPPPHMMNMMPNQPPPPHQIHPHMVLPPHVVQQQMMNLQMSNQGMSNQGIPNHNQLSSPSVQQYHPYPPHMMPPPPAPSAAQQQPVPPYSQSASKQPQQQYDQNNETNHTTTPSKQQPSFNITQSDFPALGNEQAPPQSKPSSTASSSSPPTPPSQPQPQSQSQTRPQPQLLTKPRIKFQNPSPTAPPIPASLIASRSMTSRDLCHVLHSMMRPLLALDPYNADYYRWSYDDRKSRNLLFLGGMGGVDGLPNGAAAGMLRPTPAPGGRIDLPNPVWKETKLKAAEIDDTFRSNVEKRAADWSKEKHILGKTVKNNVKRPRAMLAAGVLTSAVLLGGEEGDEEELMTDDDRQRARLWASRLASDRGYLAYLNLVELRRLLQSRPNESAALMDANTDNSRREELLSDVEENVAKLHGAFGITKKRAEEGKGDDSESSRRTPSVIDINDEVLARTLSLPKGRMLLSRVVDEGILPHPSACRVLPAAIGVLLRSVVNAHKKNKGGSVAPPPGEDRLLRSLTGLARTVQPRIDAHNVLRCLDSVNDIGKELMNTGGDGEPPSSGGGEKKLNIRDILSGKRTLMELLHAILSLGGDVCVGPSAAAGGKASLEEEWKTKETIFLSMLSS